jgi:hypothetical protein
MAARGVLASSGHPPSCFLVALAAARPEAVLLRVHCERSPDRGQILKVVRAVDDADGGAGLLPAENAPVLLKPASVPNLLPGRENILPVLKVPSILWDSRSSNLRMTNFADGLADEGVERECGGAVGTHVCVL